MSVQILLSTPRLEPQLHFINCSGHLQATALSSSCQDAYKDEEVLTFLSVCSTLRKLNDDRHLWIMVLEQAKLTRPLACPVGTDIAQLDLDTLRRVAHRTICVERNWMREKPRLVGTVKARQMRGPGQMTLLAAIPGTPLVLLEVYGHSLVCYNTETRRSIQTRVGTVTKFTHLDERGRHLVAGLRYTRNNSGVGKCSVIVLELVYGTGKPPRFRTILEADPSAQWQGHVFLVKDHVGYLNPNFTYFTVFNITTKSSRRLNLAPNTPTIAPIRRSSFTCTPLFAAGLLNRNYGIFTFSRDPFSEDGGSLDLASFVQVPQGVQPGFTQLEYFIWSPIGLQNFMVYAGYCDNDMSEYMDVQYWPAVEPGGLDLALESAATLRLTEKHMLHAYSPSGSYAIVIRRKSSPDEAPRPPGDPQFNPAYYLHKRVIRTPREYRVSLLRFVSNPSPAIETRDLELPGSIDLSDVGSMAIEERCGIIHMLLRSGRLYTARYA